MKLDPITKIWLWSAVMAGVAIAASAYWRATGTLGEWNLAIVFILVVVSLFVLALRLAKGRPRLNLTIAAETIVALGIFSLVISIAAALYGVLVFYAKDMVARELSLEDIRRFGVPFLEGLTTAALAPLIATFMRNCEASMVATESGETGLTEAAHAAVQLTQELKQAAAALTGLNKGLSDNTKAFGSAATGAAAAAGGLGTALQTETERLRYALQRMQAEATGLSDAAGKSREAFSAFGSSMSGLSSSSNDARDLLDALGKLIESVERYVRPGPASP